MKPAHAAASWRNPLRDKRDKRLPRIAGPCGMVIFGVTGDLARKKVMPAVYDLANRGLLPPTFSLVGFARRDWSTQDFGQVVYNAVQEHCRTPFRQQNWDRLAEGFRFVPGTFDDDDAFAQLAETLEKLDAERGTGGNHAFYLAIPPKSFPVVCEQLHKSGLARPQGDRWSRVVIEKPFGHDLASARELNKAVNAVFPEEAVFRIDHYLGKETVQNILALRFANQLFDPIWNAHYVDHVQITMAEDIGLGGRAGYYDGIGAARDVIQNHLMQLLALTAMEEPVSFHPAALQAEKIKVLSANRLAEPLDQTTSRGQYAAGWQGGEKVVGLLDAEGFAEDPTTETFVRRGLHHRNLRRYHPGSRYAPVGRRAVLSANGKTIGPPGDRDRSGLQAGAASAVRRHHDRRAGHQRDGHPRAARRRCHIAVRLQGAGHRHGSPRRQHGLLLRLGIRRRFTGGLRAAHPRRPARRALAVSGQRGGRTGVGDPRSSVGTLGGTRDARRLRGRYLGSGIILGDAAPHRPGMAAAIVIRAGDDAERSDEEERRR
ncbi:Glucose-6-phosphate dehydrogenase [Mycobacterium tuberculosis]|nr:Glucose-6-phosphate dehydrogenase [Mycobacterium tuberculosis]